MSRHPDKCRYPGCSAWNDITYLDKPLCDRHWAMIDTNPNLLRKKIGLPPYPKVAKKPVRRILRVMGRGIVFGETYEQQRA